MHCTNEYEKNYAFFNYLLLQFLIKHNASIVESCERDRL